MKFLGNYSETAIEAGFEGYLRTAQFFPKPADIIEILDANSQSAAAQREAEETIRGLSENRAIRERLEATGEPSGVDQYHAFIKQALDIVKRIPPPEPGRREKLLARLEEIKRRPNIA